MSAGSVRLLFVRCCGHGPGPRSGSNAPARSVSFPRGVRLPLPHPRAFLRGISQCRACAAMALLQFGRCLSASRHDNADSTYLAGLAPTLARASPCLASDSVRHPGLHNHPPTRTSLSAVLCRLPLGGRGILPCPSAWAAVGPSADGEH